MRGAWRRSQSTAACRCRSMSMVSNSDDVALPDSAHGYLGVCFAWTPGEGGGLSVRPVRSRHLRAIASDVSDAIMNSSITVIASCRTRGDRASPQRLGTRNPQSPPAHDAPRSPRPDGGACRTGIGWKGGDMFRGHAARLFISCPLISGRPRWAIWTGFDENDGGVRLEVRHGLLTDLYALLESTHARFEPEMLTRDPDQISTALPRLPLPFQ